MLLEQSQAASCDLYTLFFWRIWVAAIGYAEIGVNDRQLFLKAFEHIFFQPNLKRMWDIGANITIDTGVGTSRVGAKRIFCGTCTHGIFPWIET